MAIPIVRGQAPDCYVTEPAFDIVLGTCYHCLDLR